MSDVEKRQDRAPVPTDWTYAPAPESSDIVRLQDRYGIYVGGEWLETAGDVRDAVPGDRGAAR